MHLCAVALPFSIWLNFYSGFKHSLCHSYPTSCCSLWKFFYLWSYNFSDYKSLKFIIFSFLKKISFIYFFRERRREEKERHQWVVVSCTPPTGDLAHNPGICPDWEWNQRPFGSQAGAQSTKPHKPGWSYFLGIIHLLIYLPDKIMLHETRVKVFVPLQ